MANFLKYLEFSTFGGTIFQFLLHLNAFLTILSKLYFTYLKSHVRIINYCSLYIKSTRIWIFPLEYDLSTFVVRPDFLCVT